MHGPSCGFDEAFDDDNHVKEAHLEDDDNLVEEALEEVLGATLNGLMVLAPLKEW